MAPKKKTTTKKKTGSRPGKKTQASRQHHALNLSEHTTYLILGIMISFVALLGLFQWGALGALIVNGFRLLHDCQGPTLCGPAPAFPRWGHDLDGSN